jgi:hypothetical protein
MSYLLGIYELSLRMFDFEKLKLTKVFDEGLVYKVMLFLFLSGVVKD